MVPDCRDSMASTVDKSSSPAQSARVDPSDGAVRLHQAPRDAQRQQDPPAISCDTCAASCCRSEVWCLTDTGVPPHLTWRDPAGGTRMASLSDGWCAALDRDRLSCRIYPRRPRVCRELRVGGADCLAARSRHAQDAHDAANVTP
jgi:hypothetical protein